MSEPANKPDSRMWHKSHTQDGNNSINDPTNATYLRWRRQFNHTVRQSHITVVKMTSPALGPATNNSDSDDMSTPNDNNDNSGETHDDSDTSDSNKDATDDNMDATDDNHDSDTTHNVQRWWGGGNDSDGYSPCYESVILAYKTGLYQLQTGLNLNQLRLVL
ncbi:hypothetical protein EDB86DRAFT_2836286 [Lactarius hatsudake]|nr:hypothetical protein EDB86DRAFT_2836286 [Lactarius hatsudake]